MVNQYTAQARVQSYLDDRERIEAKLITLKKPQQNEKENVRGFTDGGASTEVDAKSAEEVKAEIAMLEALQEALKDRDGLNKAFAQAYEEDILRGTAAEQGRSIGVFECDTQANAADMAQKVVEKYNELGFECEVEMSLDGKSFTVEVEMPKGFEGQDPLNMSAKDLQAAREAMFEQRKTSEKASEENKEKAPEKEPDKAEEMAKEKELEEREQEEKKSAIKRGEEPVEVPLALMPGDHEMFRQANKRLGEEEQEQHKKSGHEVGARDDKKVLGKFTEMVLGRQRAGRTSSREDGSRGG